MKTTNGILCKSMKRNVRIREDGLTSQYVGSCNQHLQRGYLKNLKKQRCFSGSASRPMSDAHSQLPTTISQKRLTYEATECDSSNTASRLVDCHLKYCHYKCVVEHLFAVMKNACTPATAIRNFADSVFYETCFTVTLY